MTSTWCSQTRALCTIVHLLMQAESADGRQARALGQDAAGRRYYLLGGDAGAARVFVDAGPAAPDGGPPGSGGDAAVTAAEDAPASGLQRISSVASDIQGGGMGANQPPQPCAASQSQQQRLPGDGGPADGAWGWYEVDQLPALLGWLEGGDEGERALADALFEAMLPLLPAPLASTAPTQACLHSHFEDAGNVATWCLLLS